jgi:hypothetical protein
MRERRKVHGEVLGNADLERLRALKRSLQRRIDEHHSAMVQLRSELKGIEAAIKLLE